MSDAYQPGLDTLILTHEEQAAILAAMATKHPWDVENDAIASVKSKIRAHHLARHANTCCYCRTNLYGGGYFMIDREHVLPKMKYRRFTFAIWNLSVSCKRCNLQFKGESDHFVINKQDSAEFESSNNYHIVHPNYDEWELHLGRVSQQSNKSLLVIYTILNDSQKGCYTHHFFALKELEVNSFDEGQGIERKSVESDAVVEAREIAKDHGQ
jgi:hypothetical protein